MRVFALSVTGAIAAVALLIAMMWFIPGALGLISTWFGEQAATVTRDVAYGDDPRQRLDVYRPTDATAGPSPVILFLYGGSWSSGSRETYAYLGQTLASRGFTTVIPDYRLYPDVQFPAFVDDTAEAYVWTAHNIIGSCDAGRPLMIMGHSAGAHMAALLALDYRYLNAAARRAPLQNPLPKPAALIGLAGPYSFDPTIWPTTKDAFASVADSPDRARPVTFASGEAPPTLLIHGLADDTVQLKNMRDLATKLSAAGVSVVSETYEGIGHVGLVLSLARTLRWRAPTLERIITFARSIASDQSANPKPACR